MNNHTTGHNERRQDTRHPASFAFWYQRPEAELPCAAFMLNVSTGGGAFLASSAELPSVGERLELAEMYSAGHLPGNMPGLPRHARVIRVDDPDGELRRVAVRFEAPVFSKLRNDRRSLRADRVERAGAVRLVCSAGRSSTQAVRASLN